MSWASITAKNIPKAEASKSNFVPLGRASQTNATTSSKSAATYDTEFPSMGGAAPNKQLESQKSQPSNVKSENVSQQTAEIVKVAPAAPVAPIQAAPVVAEVVNAQATVNDNNNNDNNNNNEGDFKESVHKKNRDRKGENTGFNRQHDNNTGRPYSGRQHNDHGGRPYSGRQQNDYHDRKGFNRNDNRDGTRRFRQNSNASQDAADDQQNKRSYGNRDRKPSFRQDSRDDQTGGKQEPSKGKLDFLARKQEEEEKLRERFKNAQNKLCFDVVVGDLFKVSENVSLAHCVSSDLEMSKGIAVKFKEMFGRVEELASHNPRVGRCYYLNDKQRTIFYLVTKRYYNHKPTYDSLEKSLKDMRRICEQFHVAELAMPKIGSGLDKLDWGLVERIIDDTFANSNIKISIYSLN